MFTYGFSYFSLLTGVTFLGYWGWRGFTRVSKYFRSLFNAKRYLNPESPIAFERFGASNSSGGNFGAVSSQSEPARAYAVIYGVSNRAGGTFAQYLAHKGFNLILIERDIQPLNDIENNLKEKFASQKKRCPLIHKIVMSKFDQESLSENFNLVKDLPVKLMQKLEEKEC